MPRSALPAELHPESIEVLVDSREQSPWTLEDGSDGINVVFHVDQFAEVARLLRPRVRRRLSPEQRERLTMAGTAALRKYRADANADVRRDGPESTRTPQGGSEHVRASSDACLAAGSGV